MVSFEAGRTRFSGLVFGGAISSTLGVDGNENGGRIRAPSLRRKSKRGSRMEAFEVGCTGFSGLVFGEAESGSLGVDENESGCMIRGPSLRW